MLAVVVGHHHGPAAGTPHDERALPAAVAVGLQRLALDARRMAELGGIERDDDRL
jgi:hypothetical protein